MPKFDKPDSPNIIWGVNALEEDLTRPSDSKIQTGWIQEKPPYEFENYSMNKLYQGFAYYNQLGFPEWDSATEYQAGKSYVQASNGRVYKCIQTHINRNPAMSGNEDWWERLRVTDTEIKTLFNSNNSPPVFACRAWANFDGTGSIPIRGSGNISSITRISSGRYQVSFSVDMPDSNYSVCLSGSSSATGAGTEIDSAHAYDYTQSGFKIESWRFSDQVGDLPIINFQVIR